MKIILRNYGIGMTATQRQAARATAADAVTTRGTGQVPPAPRDILAQPGPRGVLLNWRPGARPTSDIGGWRIYKDDESKLFAELRDVNTTQHFIEATAGTTPPVTNFFVSSFNKLGVESQKVQIQSAAIVETGAPVMPSTPPTYTTPYTPPSGGGSGIGKKGFQGL